MSIATASEEWAYTTGGCYNLALELSRISGWPLAVEDWGTGEEEDDVYTVYDYDTPVMADHAIVIAPCGCCKVDVYGLRPNEAGGVTYTTTVTEAQMRPMVWVGTDELVDGAGGATNRTPGPLAQAILDNLGDTCCETGEGWNE